MATKRGKGDLHHPEAEPATFDPTLVQEGEKEDPRQPRANIIYLPLAPPPLSAIFLILLFPPPSPRIQPAWRERDRAECETDYTPKRHRKATYSFPLSEKNHCGSTSLYAPGSVFGKAEVRRRRKDEEGGRLEREEGAAAAADGGDEKSGPRSQGGG